MPFPVSLMTIKADKYPNTYYMLKKIAEHKIYATTLFSSAPVLPTIKQVRNSINHSIYERIFVPFCKDLQLTCKQKIIEDTPEGLKGFSFENFLSNVYIHLPSSWKGYPSRTENRQYVPQDKRQRSRLVGGYTLLYRDTYQT